MASPRPLPPLSRAPGRENLLRTVALCTAGMPLPLSPTRICTNAPSVVADNSIRPPGRVALTALSTRLSTAPRTLLTSRRTVTGGTGQAPPPAGEDSARVEDFGQQHTEAD